MALEWLTRSFNDATKAIKTEASKIKNKGFLEGVIAGVVLVAHADGIVKPSEKQKMMGFLRNHDALSLYDTDEIVRLFEKYSSKFDFDLSIGEMESLSVIGKLRNSPTEARLLVRLCCLIGAADGDFDKDERAVVSRICRELGLDPADFDL